MDCADARNWLLDAEVPAAADIMPSELAQHLAGCGACRELAAEIGRLEQAWRAMPLPAEMEPAREAFLRRLPPAPRSVRLPRRWMAAAVVLLAVGIGGGVLVSLPKASASSDVVERLVDWNLDLSRAGTADERGRIYAGSAAGFAEAVRDARLPRDERELADSLLRTAPVLAANPDPLTEADRFDAVADTLARRMTSATHRGDVRRAKRYAKLYARVADSGLAAKLEVLKGSTALDFERRRGLERLVLRDTDRMTALLELLERAPDSTRKEIRQALGVIRKAPRKKSSAAPSTPPNGNDRRGRKKAKGKAKTGSGPTSPIVE